ncbi:Hypothetical_protein [Hexamita inflata]|uniref:Hypothetical_protein n=1 Tax=Hexamita inflata TaxID=28002 RepID=A0ABP1GDZ7_9EUKA
MYLYLQLAIQAAASDTISKLLIIFFSKSRIGSNLPIVIYHYYTIIRYNYELHLIPLELKKFIAKSAFGKIQQIGNRIGANLNECNGQLGVLSQHIQIIKSISGQKV